jgi:ABC-type phosphate transport system auxiliary subunit
VKRRFAKVAYSEQTRFNPGTTIHHLAEEPKLRTAGPTRRMNQDMMRASMMQSSATTRSVASVDNQVKKIVAEKEALNAQRRRIQIAGDLEREAMSLEQAAIKAANKGVEVADSLIDQIPNIQSVASQGRTMNTALVLGAIALGVIAATMLARR